MTTEDAHTLHFEESRALLTGADGRVRMIGVVMNPEKLRTLTPLHAGS